MNAALAILALLLAAPKPGQPGTINGGKLPSEGLDFSEFAIDTGTAYTHSDQNRPSVAFDGQSYLAVWYDEPGLSGGDIMGARIASGGLLQDPHGFAICQELHVQRFPCVAFACSLYLAVWYDQRRESSGDIFGARVTTRGSVIDGNGVTICNASGAQGSPAVADGDSLWLAVWQDQRLTTSAIYGARVSLYGEVLDPGGIPIATGVGNRLSPAVAFNGTDFLVVWQNDQYGPSTVWGARVSPSGRVLDPGGSLIAGDVSQGMVATEPSVASDGQQFLVACQNDAGSRGIFARLVSADGRPLGPDNCLSSGLVGYRPTAAWDGTQYQVLWDDGRMVGARLDRAGIPKGPCFYVSAEPGAQHFGAVVGGVGQSLAAWESDPLGRDYNSQVHIARLDTSGAVLDTPTIRPWGTPVYSGQHSPALAAHEGGYVAVWESQCPYGYSAWTTDICAATLTRDGVMTDTHAFTIASLAWDELTPAVACGDSSFLVTWTWGAHRSGIYGTRISLAGEVLDPDRLTISSAGDAPAVAFDGTNYLVAWCEADNIYGSRLTQSGGVLDRLGIATTSEHETNPVVAFDGTNYLVVWQKTSASYQDDIWGARVTPEGTLLDPYGILIGPGQHMQEGPSVAFGAENYLVAWHSRYDWRVYGRMVNRAGMVVGPESIRISHWEGSYGDDWYPSVAFDGTNYLVTWLEHNYSDATEYHINGSVVSPQGLVTDTARLSRSGCQEQGPASAVGPDGRVLVLYPSVRDPNSGGRDTLPRIWGSFVSSGMGLADTPKGMRDHAALTISPNPFTRAVRFHLGPGRASPDARLTIRDAAGRCVRTFMCAQNGVLNWDGTDAAGHRLPAGIYFCTFRSGGTTVRQKLARLE